MCAQRRPEHTNTSGQKAIIPGAFHGTLQSGVTASESMQIALFRARATRGGSLSIDRIPEYIDHGVDKPFRKWGQVGRTGIKKKGKRVDRWQIPWKKKVGIVYIHPEKKVVKSNWLVVSVWSNTTKVAGSNPDGFCKKFLLFFFCF